MAVFVRRFANLKTPVLALTGVLAAVAVLAPTGAAGLRARSQAALPTLYVKYTMNCTFTISNDAGQTVSSIAPGAYQVYVSTPIMFKLAVPGGPGVDAIAPNDFTGCKGWVQFQLTGPGVNIFTTLDTGCDAYYLLPPANFAAGSTYTAQDLNQPAATRTTLTTLASGTPTAPASPYSSTTGPGSVSTDVVGSGIKTTLLGTVAGTLSASGRPTLTSNGKAVSTLKAGRYRFAVVDKDPKAGLVLRGPTPGSATSLTGVKFVGRHSATVTLKAGRWLYSSGVGKARSFLVTG